MSWDLICTPPPLDPPPDKSHKSSIYCFNVGWCFLCVCSSLFVLCRSPIPPSSFYGKMTKCWARLDAWTVPFCTRPRIRSCATTQSHWMTHLLSAAARTTICATVTSSPSFTSAMSQVREAPAALFPFLLLGAYFLSFFIRFLLKIPLSSLCFFIYSPQLT